MPPEDRPPTKTKVIVGFGFVCDYTLYYSCDNNFMWADAVKLQLPFTFIDIQRDVYLRRKSCMSIQVYITGRREILKVHYGIQIRTCLIPG